MGRLAGFKYRDVARKLKRLGWELDRQGRGSHEIWVHQQKQRAITIPKHTGDMPEGTLRAILREGEIDVDEFLNA